MNLVEVNSPQLVAKFHTVPKGIYRNDPHWIPYLKQDIEKLFQKDKNKLFKEGAEAIRWILEDDQGQLLGRIAAFINPKTLDISNFRAGGIGFFECINDQEAANMLFDASKNWLLERKLEAMDGPINFGDRSQFWGCQVTNWEEPAIYPMNYNPPYYASLFENYGFGLFFKQFMYWRSLEEPVSQLFHRKYNQLKSDNDFSVRTIRGLKINTVSEYFKEVYNAAWGGHSHFKEMSSEAALKIFKAMWPVINPDLIIFAFYKNKPIGFFVNLPELNEIFKHVKGDLNLIGKLKFLFYKQFSKPKRMVGVIFGVSREWHSKGVEAAMVVYGEKSFVKKGLFRDTVITWVGDFNPKMLKVIENLDTTLWRSLHTYRYQFDRSKPFERSPIVE